MGVTQPAPRPVTPPVVSDPEIQSVLDWAQAMFKDVQSQQNDAEQLELRPRFVAPQNPREGMIVYADGTTWNPGQGEGVYVYTNGAWVPLGLGSWTLLATTAAASGSQVNFSAITAAYTDLMFEFNALSHSDAGNQNLQVRFSTDNGSTFLTCNGNTLNDAATINTNGSTLPLGAATFAAGRAVYGRLVVPRYSTAVLRTVYGQLLQHDGAGAGAGALFAIQTPANDIDYVRWQWSAGNFDDANGSITMWGSRRG